LLGADRARTVDAMGDWGQENLWAAIGAPEVNDARLAARQARSMKPGLIVLLALLLVPALLVVLTVAILFGPALAVAPVAAVDEHFNSVPFEPGRWEADGGEYWVELRDDGTGSLRLPGSGTEGTCSPDIAEGDGTYTFVPSGGGTHGTLTVTLERANVPSCAGWSPFLSGEGWLGGGYQWDGLDYSRGDPDSVDLVLHRVD
jgi:hypothetical protein